MVYISPLSRIASKYDSLIYNNSSIMSTNVNKIIRCFNINYLELFSFNKNQLAFGQTRFATAADPIEHISEENFLLQIFAKMETFYYLTSNYFVKIISLGGWTTTDPI